jgi:hypothetical protein
VLTPTAADTIARVGFSNTTLPSKISAPRTARAALDNFFFCTIECGSMPRRGSTGIEGDETGLHRIAGGAGLELLDWLPLTTPGFFPSGSGRGPPGNSCNRSKA